MKTIHEQLIKNAEFLCIFLCSKVKKLQYIPLHVCLISRERL